MEDEAGETRLIRLSSNYVMDDGVRLVRQPQNFNKKIRVLHPDGALLAEGIVQNNTLSKYSLEIKILESSNYNTEILAMLSVDLIEQLRFQSAGIKVY